jgi:hypothetical protein
LEVVEEVGVLLEEAGNAADVKAVYGASEVIGVLAEGLQAVV